MATRTVLKISGTHVGSMKAEEVGDTSENTGTKLRNSVIHLKMIGSGVDVTESAVGGELKKKISKLDGCIRLSWKPVRFPLLFRNEDA